MKKIFVMFLLIFFVSCTNDFHQIYIDNGKKLIKINIEIADDNEERVKGLMFREKLDENFGMLFIFDNEEYQTFWMKNTLIPLDMIFIDKNFKIIDIKDAVPCKEEPCALYKSSKPAKYVLEVNGNFTMKNNIKMGDKIIMNKNSSKKRIPRESYLYIIT